MYKVAFVALICGFLLLVWLRTNAFVEYMNLLRLNKFDKIKEYNELEKNGYEGNFIDFLFEYYKDIFIIRLIACPICLSTWLGIFAWLFSSSVDFVAVAPLSLLFYTLLNKML